MLFQSLVLAIVLIFRFWVLKFGFSLVGSVWFSLVIFDLRGLDLSYTWWFRLGLCFLIVAIGVVLRFCLEV